MTFNLFGSSNLILAMCEPQGSVERTSGSNRVFQMRKVTAPH
jgi:hypothetical protein